MTWVTVREAADELGISTRTVTRLIERLDLDRGEKGDSSHATIVKLEQIRHARNANIA